MKQQRKVLNPRLFPDINRNICDAVSDSVGYSSKLVRITVEVFLIPMILFFFVLTTMHEIFLAGWNTGEKTVSFLTPKKKPKKPGPKKKTTKKQEYTRISNRDLTAILIMILFSVFVMRLVIYGEI